MGEREREPRQPKRAVPWEMHLSHRARVERAGEASTSPAPGPTCPLEATGVPVPRAAQSGLDLCPGFRENQSFRLLGAGRITKTHQQEEPTSLEEMKRQAAGAGGGVGGREIKAAVWAGQGCFPKPLQLKPGLSTGLGPAAGVGPTRLQIGV